MSNPTRIRTLAVGTFPEEYENGRPFYVTPAWALWALQFNTHNRKIRDGVERFKKILDNDEWMLTHQGICFSWEPRFLIDGQNRLYAIADGDKTVAVCVTVGRDPATQLVVDDGTIRTRTESLNLSGVETNTISVAIATAIVGGPREVYTKLTKVEISKLLIKHRDAIDYATKLYCKKAKGVTSAACLTAIARAYYHVDRDILDRFVRTLQTSVSEVGDPHAATIMTLRKFLVESSISVGRKSRLDIYRKTQAMLHAYVNGEIRMQARAVEADLFPLKD
jgi:hypothetical protein